MVQEKPQCISAVSVEAEYDVELHVVGSWAGFPVVAKRFKCLKMPPSIFFACKHFGTGVLVATAFVHLLPTAFGNLLNPCLPDLFTDKFPPLPGGIMMASMFILFVIEMFLNTKISGHSHGGPTGERVVNIHNAHNASPLSTLETTASPMSSLSGIEKSDVQKQKCNVDDTRHEINPLILRTMSDKITLLEGGILFHSVFVGMTLSITIDGFIILLIAFIFHRAFEGLSLGSRIAAVLYPRASVRPWLLVVAFGITAPLGQAIGLGARNTYNPNSAFGLVIVGMFNAISSGLLLYAALVDLLAEDFLSGDATQLMNAKQKALAFGYVLLGSMAMSIVGAFA